MKKIMLFAGVLALTGCPPTKDSGDPDTDTTETTELAASVTWGSSSVDLTLTNGEGISFFGMAETGSTCTDSCWTGEDCTYGFEGSDTTYLYCHPTAATGVSLAYGGAFDAINEGTDTVFGDNSFDGSVTYYLEGSDGSCYVWGNDASYYSAEGCDAL